MFKVGEGCPKSSLLRFKGLTSSYNFSLEVTYFHYKRHRVSILIPRGGNRGIAKQHQPKQDKNPAKKEQILKFCTWHLGLRMELSGDKQPWVGIFIGLSIAHMTSFRTAPLQAFQLSSANVPGSPLVLRLHLYCSLQWLLQVSFLSRFLPLWC